MTPIARYISLFRVCASGDVRETTLRVACDPTGPHFQLESWPDAPRNLQSRALNVWSRLLNQVPPSRQHELIVEGGMVVTDVLGISHLHHFISALTGDFVIGLRHCESCDVVAGPWSGECRLADVPLYTSVIVEPSATLTLVTCLLESPSLCELETDACCFDVVDTASSPYPPQHYPWRLDGSESEDAPFDIPRAPSLADDAVFSLMARAHSWHSPVGCLRDPRRRNLRLEHRGSRRATPEAYLAIESVAPLEPPRSGRTQWRAAWSYYERGERRAGSPKLNLALDAGKFLDASCSPLTLPLPACTADPIEGDQWGYAPRLLTSTRLSSMHGYLL
jgi:hypothetical protein